MLAEAPCNYGIFFFFLISPTYNKTERLEDIIGLQNPYRLPEIQNLLKWYMPK